MARAAMATRISTMAPPLLFLLVTPAWLEGPYDLIWNYQNKLCWSELRRLQHRSVGLHAPPDDQDPDGRVREGAAVGLECPFFCRRFEREDRFVWFKNGLRLPANTSQLHLESVSRQDSGEYTCALSGFEDLVSQPVILNVRYSPKVFSVTATLLCEADANPPVEDYVWYKEGQSSPVAFGKSFRISSIAEEDISQYYCEAQNSSTQHSARPSSFGKRKEDCPTALAVAAGLCGCWGALATTVLIARLCVSRSKKKTSSPHNKITDGEHDVYADLDPESRASNSVYTDLTTLHSRSPNAAAGV
ncbi:cell adhesion molecule CEACAM5-like [Brachyhypopomus gauderio]|uniref:cell adhesion molecule CEACAM5-like n=1 Tax=Brachyhypopomus gauderio TaxID=698409 RepID=UPI0040414C39